jgi:GNAT superfamily N-acetyltransferase
LFNKATVLHKFIESLICTNRTWVIERNYIIGVISVGNLNETWDDFKRRATFRDCVRILSAAALPSLLPKLIGGLFYIVRKPKAPSQLEITWIAIDHSMHGKGLGGELLNVAVASILQKSGVIWVKTLVSTPENLSFYQKHHFEISHHVGGRVILTRSLGDSTCIQ